MTITPLITRRDITRDFCWVIEEPLVYEDEDIRITVLPGFDFDFASIPRGIWNILPKNGAKYDRAACIHDALYASRLLRKEHCDLLFKKIMLFDEVNEFIANTMYKAVDWFGQSAYDEGDEEVSHYRELVRIDLLKV